MQYRKEFEQMLLQKQQRWWEISEKDEIVEAQ